MKNKKFSLVLSEKDAYKVWQAVTSAQIKLKIPHRIMSDLYKIFKTEGQRKYIKTIGEWVVREGEIIKKDTWL